MHEVASPPPLASKRRRPLIKLASLGTGAGYVKAAREHGPPTSHMRLARHRLADSAICNRSPSRKCSVSQLAFNICFVESNSIENDLLEHPGSLGSGYSPTSILLDRREPTHLCVLLLYPSSFIHHHHHHPHTTYFIKGPFVCYKVGRAHDGVES